MQNFPPGTLIIIDEKEMAAGIGDSIDPTVIESISVLKGSDARATYGDKAKNGVIIITTKKSHSPTIKKTTETKS